MKIRSRPEVKQSCEEIVENALSSLQQPPSSSHGVSQVMNLTQHEHALLLVMKTLFVAGTLTDFEIGTPKETSNSTYEKEEWVITIKFTDAPRSSAKREGYVADLLYQFNR